jgi:SAM-dependent methyltransferase
MKRIIKKFPFIKRVISELDNQYERDVFVISELKKINAGSKVLDAGCGSQRYRIYCNHLHYHGQDFGQYSTDEKKMIGTEGMGGAMGYAYGGLDYIGNVWAVDESDAYFDVILCTEVFEHIPYPIETIKEFSRLLKPGGTLILTAPSNCLRHMDPFFFYSGFSDRWYEKFLNDFGFKITTSHTVGDYYRWLAVEIARTAMSHSIISKVILFPSFLYYFFKKKTPRSIDTLCMGYLVAAIKQ